MVFMFRFIVFSSIACVGSGSMFRVYWLLLNIVFPSCVVSRCYCQTGKVGISMTHDSQSVVSRCCCQTGKVGIFMTHDSLCVVSRCYCQTGKVGISMAHDSLCVVSGCYS